MKINLKSIFTKLDRQFFLVSAAVFLLVVALGFVFFNTTQQSSIQFASLIGIAVLFFLLFLFSLWKLNQKNQWVSIWAIHPFWIAITFVAFPLLLTLIWNIPDLSNTIPPELTHQLGNILSPHFLFFYIWEALVFGIVFLSHPKRTSIVWNISINDLVYSLILGLGIWSLTMFINEIILQWLPQELNYQENRVMFWPILPVALIFIPIALSFHFFYLYPTSSKVNIILRAFLFSVLPLRAICLIPALITALVLGFSKKARKSFPILIFSYAVINLLLLLINWQWII
ncbi:MAG: hypothetical protein JEZ00_07770 [Anaerolineaceae bacterium]|nr:hypothetical protein [Anaerolineaceae bacterium]